MHSSLNILAHLTELCMQCSSQCSMHVLAESAKYAIQLSLLFMLRQHVVVARANSLQCKCSKRCSNSVCKNAVQSQLALAATTSLHVL
jgi:hypothetical protein